MKIIIRILIALAGIFICCVLALLVATVLAETGMLGSCFEGSCGYAAMFLAFPLLWIGLTIAFFIVWWRWARRRRAR